jgi:hypothetical protein
MAKYNVTFSCGHTESKELFGSERERRAKIEYWEKSGKCTECYEKEKYADCDEIEMSYAEYKRNYADCKAKSGSYDAKSKTIIVYVPKTPPEEKPETDSFEGRKAAIKKVAEETGLPVEALEKIFISHDSKMFLKMTEENKDKMLAVPDKTGKHENAYAAAIWLGSIAKKYGL